MKKTLSLAILMSVTAIVYGQQSNAGIIAEKIAIRMKDTLQLTSQQKDQLYAVNMQLHNQKMLIRQQYSGIDSLRTRTQVIENSRDSLYHGILPEEKYILYLQKKRILVNNN